VEQVDLLRHLIDVLEGMGVPYMLVGSFASGAYGEPRLTQDIDVVVDLPQSRVGEFCGAFPSQEYYVSPEAASRAAECGGQFHIIHPTSGNKIDVLIARTDAYGRAQLARRQRVRILPDQDGYTARPEDVIIGKMEYYREGGSEKHLRDITGILMVSGDEVDRDYVTRWARELSLSEIWEAILRRLERREG